MEKGLVTPVTAHRRVSTSVVLGRGAGSWGADPSTSPHTTPSSAHQGLAPGGADAAAPSEGGKSASMSSTRRMGRAWRLGPATRAPRFQGCKGGGRRGQETPPEGRAVQAVPDARLRLRTRRPCAGKEVTGRPAAARVGTVLCHLAPCVPQGDLARGLVAFWGRGVLCPGGAGAGGAGRPERERVPAGVTRLTAGFSIPCP